ncbi:hypothetical protein [Armatimonas sp.]|uniref:hypothetical protein n=1 Tax=Armatimonas sp. TaxID=1872638 RepID=UPI00286B39B3|nr:hypothetical protein [Armatimonas sp.]
MSEETEKNKEPLSRRDFLRRAGKEAVDTGTKLVPGGNLARQALGMQTTSALPWWNVMAKWRQKRTDEETKEQDTGTDNG